MVASFALVGAEDEDSEEVAGVACFLGCRAARFDGARFFACASVAAGVKFKESSVNFLCLLWGAGNFDSPAPDI